MGAESAAVEDHDAIVGEGAHRGGIPAGRE